MKALKVLLLITLSLSILSAQQLASQDQYKPCKLTADCSSDESCVRGTCRLRLPGSGWCSCPDGNYCFFGICLNVNRNHWTCIHPLECPDNRKCVDGTCRGM